MHGRDAVVREPLLVREAASGNDRLLDAGIRAKIAGGQLRL